MNTPFETESGYVCDRCGHPVYKRVYGLRHVHSFVWLHCPGYHTRGCFRECVPMKANVRVESPLVGPDDWR